MFYKAGAFLNKFRLRNEIINIPGLRFITDKFDPGPDQIGIANMYHIHTDDQ